MVIEKYLYYINKNKNICIYTPNIPLPLTLPPYPASCFIFINLWKHTLLDSDVFFSPEFKSLSVAQIKQNISLSFAPLALGDLVEIKLEHRKGKELLEGLASFLHNKKNRTAKVKILICS